MRAWLMPWSTLAALCTSGEIQRRHDDDVLPAEPARIDHGQMGAHGIARRVGLRGPPQIAIAAPAAEIGMGARALAHPALGHELPRPPAPPAQIKKPHTGEVARRHAELVDGMPGLRATLIKAVGRHEVLHAERSRKARGEGLEQILARLALENGPEHVEVPVVVEPVCSGPMASSWGPPSVGVVDRRQIDTRSRPQEVPHGRLPLDRRQRLLVIDPQLRQRRVEPDFFLCEVDAIEDVDETLTHGCDGALPRHLAPAKDDAAALDDHERRRSPARDLLRQRGELLRRPAEALRPRLVPFDAWDMAVAERSSWSCATAPPLPSDSRPRGA